MRNRRNSIRAIAMASALAASLAACAGDPPSAQSTGKYVDDSVITAKVKGALVAEKQLSTTDISVATFNGRVVLTGYVKSPDERQRAEGLARSVDGVKEISNRIELKQ